MQVGERRMGQYHTAPTLAVAGWTFKKSLLNAYIWGAVGAETLKNMHFDRKSLLNAYIWGAEGAETLKNTDFVAYLCYFLYFLA